MFSFFLYFIIFFQTTRIFCSESKPFTINKCCSKGQQLELVNGAIECKEISLANKESYHDDAIDNFDWFPIEWIVNATTLKIHENHTDKYLQILKENYEIKEAFFPDCGEYFHPELASSGKFSSSFHFIINEDLTLNIHISKNSSLHDPENDFIKFEKATDMGVDFRMSIENEKLRTLPLGDGCVDYGPNMAPILVFCPCLHMACIRKCCFDGEFLNETSNSCEEIADSSLKNWRPRIEGILDEYYLIEMDVPTHCERLHLLKESENTCSARTYEDTDNEFEILPNGSIKIRRYKKIYSSEDYCGEITWKDGGTVRENLILCMTGNLTIVEHSSVRSTIYGSLMIIGGICLLVTVVISFFLPELKSTIYNKIALSHNFSLMVACFAWGILHLSFELGGNACIFMGSLIQFTFLASFFWLNVMCIDISMAFRTVRSVGGGFTTSGEHKKFIFYNLYAWGSTSFITTITIIMETSAPYHYLKPGFFCHCGFTPGTWAVFIYFYGPMALILSANLVLFIFTTIKILALRRQKVVVSNCKSNSSRLKSYYTDKQKLILCAKLFVITGLSWFTEILSWIIGGPNHYWYFTDCINLLRAVFIFILFICKKSIFNSLKRRLIKRETPPSPESTKSESTGARHDTLRMSCNARNNARGQEKSNLPKEKQKVQFITLTNMNYDVKETSM